eukprot:scaffold144637_cov46-Cyclotella_meneghiniana.AAC.1
MLCGLDWNALCARVSSTDWMLSAGRVKSSVVAPTEESRVSDCEDLFILTLTAGLSQCLIVDMMNDVMWSGLECFASKGLLHRLDFEYQEGEKFSYKAPTQESQVSDCELHFHPNSNYWTVPMSHCGYDE